MGRLLRTVQPTVYRFGMNMCGHPEDAEEVAQHTLLTVARKLPTFRGEASLSTWIFRIARSFCIKERRRRKNQPAVHDSIDDLPDGEQPEAPSTDEANPEQAIARAEMGAQLRRSLALLDPMYREVVVLRDIQGLKSEEVAAVLDLTVAAVKSRLHRGRAALRDHMTRITAPPTKAGCPDLRMVFSRYLEGELDAAQCAAMEQHLAACPHCKHSCDCIKETFALCQQAGQAPIAGDVERTVRRALEAFVADAGCSTKSPGNKR